MEYLLIVIIPSSTFGPIGWGYKIHHFCGRGETPPTNVLLMTLNNLMVRLLLAKKKWLLFVSVGDYKLKDQKGWDSETSWTQSYLKYGRTKVTTFQKPVFLVCQLYYKCFGNCIYQHMASRVKTLSYLTDMILIPELDGVKKSNAFSGSNRQGWILFGRIDMRCLPLNMENWMRTISCGLNKEFGCKFLINGQLLQRLKSLRLQLKQ